MRILLIWLFLGALLAVVGTVIRTFYTLTDAIDKHRQEKLSFSQNIPGKISNEYLSCLKGWQDLSQLKLEAHKQLVEECNSTIKSLSVDPNKKVILLTGYGLYGSNPQWAVKKNVTEALVRKFDLKDSSNQDIQVIKIVLPVEWKSAKEILTCLFNKLPRIDVAIAMGHHPQAEGLILEQYYFNISYYWDNLGQTKNGDLIVKNGPGVIKATADLKKIVQNVSGNNIPVKIHGGIDGMGYLCNYAAYLVSYNCLQINPKAEFLFIHMPPPEKLDFDKTLTALGVIVKTLVGD